MTFVVEFLLGKQYRALENHFHFEVGKLRET